MMDGSNFHLTQQVNLSSDGTSLGPFGSWPTLDQSQFLAIPLSLHLSENPSCILPDWEKLALD
ncbi:hypothetical protein AKJ16_DCAP21303 [Drosera capensis]